MRNQLIRMTKQTTNKATSFKKGLLTSLLLITVSFIANAQTIDLGLSLVTPRGSMVKIGNSVDGKSYEFSIDDGVNPIGNNWYELIPATGSGTGGHVFDVMNAFPGTVDLNHNNVRDDNRGYFQMGNGKFDNNVTYPAVIGMLVTTGAGKAAGVREVLLDGGGGIDTRNNNIVYYAGLGIWKDRNDLHISIGNDDSGNIWDSNQNNDVVDHIAPNVFKDHKKYLIMLEVLRKASPLTGSTINVYVEEVFVTGKLSFPNKMDLTNPSHSFDNAFAGNWVGQTTQTSTNGWGQIDGRSGVQGADLMQGTPSAHAARFSGGFLKGFIINKEIITAKKPLWGDHATIKDYQGDVWVRDKNDPTNTLTKLGGLDFDITKPVVTQVGTTFQDINENYTGPIGQVQADEPIPSGGWSITNSTGHDLSIDDSGEVFLNTAVDYENPNTNNIIAFQIIATDDVGNVSDPFNFSIDVLDILVENFLPVITSSGTATAIDENPLNPQAIYTITATDNENDPITYGLDSGTGTLDSDLFEIVNNNEVQLKSSSDNYNYEKKSSYDFIVTADDNNAGIVKKWVTLKINDVDEEAPKFEGSRDVKVSLEGLTSNTVVYDALARDNGGVDDAGVDYSINSAPDNSYSNNLFNINTDGEIRFNLVSTVTVGTSYKIWITGADKASPPNSASYDVRITIVEGPSLVISDNISTSETNQNFTFTFTFNENVTGFDATDITLTAGGTSVNVNAANFSGNNNVYTLNVIPPTTNFGDIRVEVPEGAGTGVGTRNSLSTADAFGIQTYDTLNPVIESPAVKQVNLAAITANPTAIVYDAQASDKNRNYDDGITYPSLKGTDKNDLDIDSESGEINFTSTPTAIKTYNIRILADDTADNGVTKNVQIAVVDNPAINITTDHPNTIAKTSVVFKIAFSEPVRDFDANDVTVQYNGNNNFPIAEFTQITKSFYTFRVAPTASTVGDIVVNVSANAATGEISNLSTPTLAVSEQQHYDSESPAINTPPIFNIDENALGQLGSLSLSNTEIKAVEWRVKSIASNTFNIDNANNDITINSLGIITLNKRVDYEASPITKYIDFAVQAKDLAGNKVTINGVRVSIGDIGENTAPTINSGPTAMAIDEGTGSGQIVYTVTATDGQNDPLTYSLDANQDQGSLFSIDTDNGEVVLTGNPDHEDRDSYTFHVKASDGTLESPPQQVTLAINDVNEAPVITSGPVATAINEGIGSGQVVYTISATDIDDGATTTYGLLDPPTDSAEFELDNTNTDEVKLKLDPDHEIKSSYNFYVTATDNGTPPIITAQQVTLYINDVVADTPPVFHSASSVNGLYDSNNLPSDFYTARAFIKGKDYHDDITYSLPTGVFSNDSFLINGQTGVVSFTQTVNALTAGNYLMAITATDNTSNIVTTKHVVVRVFDNTQPQPLATITEPNNISPVTKDFITLTVKFTEAPTTTFVKENLSVRGGKASSVQGSGTTYTVRITPSSDAFGTLRVRLKENEVNTSNGFAITAEDYEHGYDTAAPVFISPQTVNVSISEEQVYNADATDNSGNNDGITYTLVSGEEDNDEFIIDPNLGIVSFDPSFYPPTAGTKTIKVTATDLAGNETVYAVTITLDDDPTVDIRPVAGTSAITKDDVEFHLVFTEALPTTANNKLTLSNLNAYVDVSSNRTSLTQHSQAAQLLILAPSAVANVYTLTVKTSLFAANSIPTLGDIVVEMSTTTTINGDNSQRPVISGQVVPQAYDITDPVFPTSSPENTTIRLDTKQAYNANAKDNGNRRNDTGITYSLTGGNNVNEFTINLENGVVEFKGIAPSSTGTYNIDITATDFAGNTKVHQVVINVVDELKPVITTPVLSPGTIVNTNFDVGFNFQTVVDNFLSNPGNFVTAVYNSTSLTIDNFRDDPNGISNQQFIATVTLPIAITNAGDIEITVLANAAQLTGTSINSVQSDTVTQNFDNEPPTFSDSVSSSINENTVGLGSVSITNNEPGAVTWNVTNTSLSGVTTPPTVSIDSNGDISLSAGINYEDLVSPYELAFTVTASDIAGNRSASLSKTVTINDALEIDISNFTGANAVSIDENVIGILGTVIQEGSRSVTWSIESINSNDFSLVANNLTIDGSGEIRLNKSANYENDPLKTSDTFTFKVKVEDSQDSSKFVISSDITITVSDINDAPAITSGAVASFDPTSSSTIYTIDADDEDFPAQSITFGTQGSDATPFTLDTSSGALTITSPGASITQTSYTFFVTASDGTDTTSQELVLSVNQVIPPTFNGSNNNNVSLSDLQGSPAANLIAYNAQASLDGQNYHQGITYSLDGASDVLFNIDASGVISFDSAAAGFSSLAVGDMKLITIIATETGTQNQSSYDVTINIVGDSVVAITSTNTIPVINGNITVQFKFSELVINSSFDANDLTVTGGTLVGAVLTPVSGTPNIDFEIEVSPSANNFGDLIVALKPNSVETEDPRDPQLSVFVAPQDYKQSYDTSAPVFNPTTDENIIVPINTPTVYNANAIDNNNADYDDGIKYAITRQVNDSNNDLNGLFIIDSTTGIVQFDPTRIPSSVPMKLPYTIEITATDNANNVSTSNKTVEVTVVDAPVVSISSNINGVTNQPVIFTLSFTDEPVSQGLNTNFSVTDLVVTLGDGLVSTTINALDLATSFAALTGSGKTYMLSVDPTSISSIVNTSAPQNGFPKTGKITVTIANTLKGDVTNKTIVSTGTKIQGYDVEFSDSITTSSVASDVDENTQGSLGQVTTGETVALWEIVDLTTDPVGAVILSIDSSTGIISLDADINYDTLNTKSFTFKVKGTDPVGNTAESTPITVAVNDALEIDISNFTGANAVSIDENVIGILGTVIEEGSRSVSWRIESINSNDFSLTKPNVDITIDGSGEIRLNKSANYENDPLKTSDTFTFKVKAEDSQDSSKFVTSSDITITVSDINDAPAITSGAVASFDPTSSSTIYTIDADDEDFPAQSITFGTQGSDATPFTLDTSSGALTITSPGASITQTSYTFFVTASDGTDTTSQELVLSVNQVIPPTFNGSNNNNVSLSDLQGSPAANLIAYNAQASLDGQNYHQGITYSLDGASDVLFNIDASGVISFDSAAAGFSSLAVGDMKLITIIATETGTQNQSSYDVTINIVGDSVVAITSTNTIPVINGNITVQFKFSELVINSSFDANDLTVTGGTLVGAVLTPVSGTPNIDFEIEVSPSANNFGDLIVALKPNSVETEDPRDPQLSVFVAPQDYKQSYDTSAPVFNPTTDENIIVPINTPTVYNANAIDNNNADYDDGIKYAITRQVNDSNNDLNGLFIIDSTTGIVQFDPTRIPSSVPMKLPYTIEITATDNANNVSTSNKTVEVTVVDAPVVSISSNINGVTNQPVIFTLSFTDEPVSQGLNTNFSVTDLVVTLGDGLVSTTINASDLATNFARLTGSGKTYMLSVDPTSISSIVNTSAPQNGFPKTGKITVTIANTLKGDVTNKTIVSTGTKIQGYDVEFSDSITTSSVASDVDENTQGSLGQVTTGETVALWEIVDLTTDPVGAVILSIDSSTGIISLDADINYDTLNTKSFTFKVKGTDPVGNTAESTPITVAVNDALELDNTQVNNSSVNENTLGVLGTIIADKQGVTWSIKSIDSNPFGLDKTNDDITIHASSGVITLAKSLNYEDYLLASPPNDKFTFTVSAELGSETVDSKVTITVTDINDAPVITSSNTASVIENVSVNTVIYTIIASDEDRPDDDLTYELVSLTDTTKFAINGAQVSLTEKPDFENQPSYTFFVNVKDVTSNASNNPYEVTLEVVNVSDTPPKFYSEQEVNVSHKAITVSPFKLDVYNAQASLNEGPYDTGITYDFVSGGDAGLFDINTSTGVVSFKSSSVQIQTYNIRILAEETGNTSNNESISVKIHVLDQPAVTITSSSANPVIKDPVTYTFTFTEEVTGFELADIHVAGGTKGTTLSTVTADKEFTVVVTPTADSYGNIEVTLNEGAAMGTISKKRTSSVKFKQGYDTAPPVFSSQSATVNISVGATKAYNAIARDNGGNDHAGIKYSLTGVDNTLTFDIDEDFGNVTFKAGQSATLANSPYTIQITAMDGVLNATTHDVEIATFDRPTVEIRDTTKELVTNQPVTFEFEFSEDVTGFNQNMVKVSGVDPANIGTLTGSGKFYSVVITPDSDTNDGIITVALEAGAAISAPSNEPPATQAYDTKGPTLDTTNVPSDIAEGSDLGTVTAGADDIFNWEIVNESSKEVLITRINATSAAITLNLAADYERVTSYTFNVKATDFAGNETTTNILTVAVNEINDDDIVITSSMNSNIDENTTTKLLGFVSANKPVTWDIIDANADVSINALGIISLDTEVDYETPTMAITFTVKAEDGQKKETTDFTVNVNDVIDYVDKEITTSTTINGNVEITSSGFLTVDNNASINGDVTIASKGKLTLKGTGTIGKITLTNGASFIAKEVNTNSDIGEITYVRTIPTTNWHFISSPVKRQDIDAFVTASSLAENKENSNSLNFSNYNTSNGEWAYYQADSNGKGNFVPGEGYSIKKAVLGSVTFAGINNFDNTTTIPLIAEGHASSNNRGFNLLGNPYLSYISVSEILAENTDVLSEQTVWLWNQAADSGKGDYVLKNLATDLEVAPTQGFFVRANIVGGDFVFTKGMQSHRNQVEGEDDEGFEGELGPFRGGTVKSEITLTLDNGENVRTTSILYTDEATKGFDNGYDSSIFKGVGNDFAVYTRTAENSEGRSLGIQSLPQKDYENTVIPIGVKAAENSTLQFSASAVNLPEDTYVYLQDLEANIFKRIDNETYNVTTSGILDGAGRFYLHTTSIGSPTNLLDNVIVYVSNNNTLKIEGISEGETKIRIYSFSGKLIINETFMGNVKNRLALPKLRRGVYLIQIEGESEVVNKKVIIR